MTLTSEHTKEKPQDDIDDLSRWFLNVIIIIIIITIISIIIIISRSIINIMKINIIMKVT